MPEDLIAWLRAQIETDKAAAEELNRHCMGCWYSTQELFDGWGPLDWDEAEHIAKWTPRDVIADCDAKLAIVDQAEREITDAPAHAYDYESEVERTRAATLGEVVRMLAQGYQHRDGYREEWRP